MNSIKLTTSFSHVFSWQHFSRAVSLTKTLIQVYPKVNALLRSTFHPPQHLSCTSRLPAAAGKPGKGLWSIASLWGWRQRQRRQSDEHSLAYMLPWHQALLSWLGEYVLHENHSFGKISSVLFLVISHLSTEQMLQGMKLEHYYIPRGSAHPSLSHLLAKLSLLKLFYSKLDNPKVLNYSSQDMSSAYFLSECSDIKNRISSWSPKVFTQANPVTWLHDHNFFSLKMIAIGSYSPNLISARQIVNFTLGCSYN